MIWSILYVAAALAATAWAVHVARSRKWVFLIMSVSLIVLGFVGQGCLCSVGTIQNIISGILGNPGAITLGALLLFGLPILASFFWGRVFCGGVCPLGGMQDLLNVTRIKVPRWLDAILKMGPLIVLGAVFLAIIRGDGYLLCKYDFIVPFFRFHASGIILFIGIVGIIITTFLSRPFCRYLCPYGMILGGAGFFARRKVEVSPKSCVKCSFCGDVCLVNAIERPAELIEKEKPQTATLWLTVAILLMPFWAIGFRDVGSRIAVPKKTAKQIVALSEKDKLSKKQEERLATFTTEARETSQKGGIVGIVFGLAWGTALIVLTRRKTNPFYQPNSISCVDCGRCYNHCPQGSPRGAPPKWLDHVFGHLRHRIKEDGEKQKRNLKRIAVLLGLVLSVLSVMLIKSHVEMNTYNPLKQPELKKLQVAIKMDQKNSELREEFRMKSETIRNGFNSASRIHTWLMVGFVLTLVSLSSVLKYRHNRYVLPFIKPKVDKSTVQLHQVLIARFGVIGFGVILIVILLSKFPALPL